MKIKFVQNFRGRETGERFFQIGDVSDTVEMAASLIERGIAVEVKQSGHGKDEEHMPEAKPAPKAKATPKPRRKAPAKVEGSK